MPDVFDMAATGFDTIANRVVAKDGLKASLIEDGAGTSPNRRAIAALVAPEGAARAVKRAGESDKRGTSLFC